MQNLVPDLGGTRLYLVESLVRILHEDLGGIRLSEKMARLVPLRPSPRLLPR